MARSAMAERRAVHGAHDAHGTRPCQWCYGLAIVPELPIFPRAVQVR